MGICTDCGRNDQEPLAACPKCTLGEQGDSDLPVIDELRRQLAAVTAERDRLKGSTQELEIDRLRQESASFRRIAEDNGAVQAEAMKEIARLRAMVLDLELEKECILATQKHWIFSTREKIRARDLEACRKIAENHERYDKQVHELLRRQQARLAAGPNVANPYAWDRCDHSGIGLPGCPTCDPDKHRCLERSRYVAYCEVNAEREAICSLIQNTGERQWGCWDPALIAAIRARGGA